MVEIIFFDIVLKVDWVSRVSHSGILVMDSIYGDSVMNLFKVAVHT